MTGNFTNDGRTTTIFFAADFKEIFTKFLVLLEIALPSSGDVEDYDRVSFRSTMDVNELLNGKNTNFILKLLMNSIVRSIEPKVSFPLRKTYYKLPNLTFPELPSFAGYNTKFLANVKFHVKIIKTSKMVYVSKIILKGIAQ